jgi:hypothetical protein
LRHSRVAGVLVPVVLVVAAGCGTSTAPSGGKHLSPHQVVLASVDATEAASSAAIGVSVSVSGAPTAAGPNGSLISVTVTGHGEYSFANKTGEMTLTVPTSGAGSAATIQVREIGHDLYISTPALTGLDGGKTWVEVDLSQLRQQQGQSVSGVGALSEADPSQILALLQQLGGSVTRVGTADAEGVPTTEYQGRIDLAASSGTSSIVSRQVAQSLGLSDVPVDVWVDGAGRARQVATSFTVIGVSIKAQVNFGNFGVPVSVSAPPAGDTANGSSLLQSGGLGDVF